MKLAQFSVYRPITIFMFFCMVVLFGVISFIRLPIDLMPDLTFPTITVSTDYSNVGPEEIEQLITRPLEETVSSIQGVEKITSTSSEGNSRVVVSFVWGTNLDNAANDVRERIDRIRARIPEDADAPRIFKFDLSAFPVLFFGVSGNLDPVELRYVVEHQLKYRIERIPGVAAIDIRGGLSREIHVNLDRRKLTALNLSLDTVLNSLEAENLNLPAGKIDDGNLEALVRTQGEFRSLDEIRNTVVQVQNGIPLLVKDIATVEDSYQELTSMYRSNGIPVLIVSVNKQSGSNTVQVAEGVIEEIERINRDFPQLHVFVTMDSSEYIKRSIANVRDSAYIGAILAALILFFFLRNLRSTLIISIAIPISITATFALMYYYNLTLNIMTFGGLALGVGMLVDNAIVVLENIFRNFEEGKSNVKAAIHGAEEVAVAVMASTLTTLVVFLPVVFVRGVSGVTFRQLSIVVVFSLFCSLAVSLTLIPMLCSRFLRRGKQDAQDRMRITHSGRLLSWIENEYLHLLRFALHHRGLVIILVLLLLGASVWMSGKIGVEFMPKADESDVRVSGEMAVGTRLEVIDDTFKEIEQIVRKAVPEAKMVYYHVGASGWRDPANTGEVRVSLVPPSERQRSSEAICRALRPLLAHIPGIIIRVREGQGLFLLRLVAGGEEAAEVQIRGYDMDTARILALRVQKEMEQVEGVTDVRISRTEGQPEEIVRIDRAKASALGLSVSHIAHAIETSLSGTSSTMYRDGGDEYEILVRLQEADRLALSDVLNMTVTSQSGRSVVLKNVVHLERSEGPVKIEREDQERIITVSGNITNRDLGSIMKDIEQRIASIPLPQDFEIKPSGEYEEQQKSFRELLFGFALALVLVFMVMASQFESLRDPFVVMFAIPLAAIGVIFTLIITETTFNMQAFIGCIMLAGIVVNNAIILVDYTNLLRRRDRMPLLDAIQEGGRRRLRPILMTTLTTVVGLIPMALGMGDGGEVQAPMARVVIGGLTSSTIITLVITPTLYSIFESRHKETLIEEDEIQ